MEARIHRFNGGPLEGKAEISLKGSPDVLVKLIEGERGPPQEWTYRSSIACTTADGLTTVEYVVVGDGPTTPTPEVSK